MLTRTPLLEGRHVGRRWWGCGCCRLVDIVELVGEVDSNKEDFRMKIAVGIIGSVEIFCELNGLIPAKPGPAREASPSIFADVCGLL